MTNILFPVGSPFKPSNKMSKRNDGNNNMLPTPFQTVSLSLPDLAEINENGYNKNTNHNKSDGNNFNENNSSNYSNHNHCRRSKRIQNKTSNNELNNNHSDIICDIPSCDHPKKHSKSKQKKNSPKPNLKQVKDKNTKTKNKKKISNTNPNTCNTSKSSGSKEELDEDDIDDEETESEDDGQNLILLGHEWGDNTDLASKRLIKHVESKILKRVDIIKDGFKQNTWYIYVDVDANDEDKMWVNRSTENYKPKVMCIVILKF